MLSVPLCATNILRTELLLSSKKPATQVAHRLQLAEAELMEAELLLDHKRGGSSKAKKPAVPKSRRELAALMDDCLEDAVSYTHLTLPTICSV